MTRRQTLLSTSLVLAGGILAGTAASAAAVEAGWWILSGPVILAVSIIAATYLLRDRRSGSVYGGMVLSGAVLAAGAILGASDPSSLLTMMPIFGAAAAGVLVVDGARCERRLSRTD